MLKVTTGAAIYVYSKMTWAHQLIGKVILYAKLFLNSHLHHSFPTWDNVNDAQCAHTFFISFFSFEISTFTFLLFSCRAYAFFSMCISLYTVDRLKRKDNATFGPHLPCHAKITLSFLTIATTHWRRWWVANVVFGMHIIQLVEKSSLCAFHIFLVSLQCGKKSSHYIRLYTQTEWIMNRCYTTLFKYELNMIELWLTDLFVYSNI